MMKTEKTIGAVIALVTMIAVLFYFGLNVYTSLQTTHMTATVIEKFVDEGNVYFTVETTDGRQEVLSNEDSILRGKFNSRDFVSEIEVGKTYYFTLNSKRIPFLSMNLNILAVEERGG